MELPAKLLDYFFRSNKSNIKSTAWEQPEITDLFVFLFIYSSLHTAHPPEYLGTRR